MANTNIDGTISTLFHGMDGFVSSKSVVGDPIKVGDTIIIPLLDVNFGMAAGAFNKQTGNNAAGGIGAKLSPAAVLVISNGNWSGAETPSGIKIASYKKVSNTLFCCALYGGDA